MYRDGEASGPLLIIAFGEYVIAVARRTGVIAWQYQEDVGSPRLHIQGTSVILAFGHSFVCLDYATGRVKWRTAAPDSATDTMLIDGDELFFGERGRAGCIDINTGALLWHHPFKGMGTHNVALGVPGNATQFDRF